MKTHVDPLMFTPLLNMKNDQGRRGIRSSRDSRNLYLHVISVCAHVPLQTVTAYTKRHINFKISYDIPGIDTALKKTQATAAQIPFLQSSISLLQFFLLSTSERI